MDSNVDDGANISGSTTEPIPSTELARMLEEHGVRFALPETPFCSTNPFSLSELIRRHSEKDAASPVLQKEGEDEAEGAPNVPRYRRAVLDVAAKTGGTALPGALSYQKLFLTQSKENVGLTIQTLTYVPSTQAGQRVPAAESPAQLLYCTLVFDPAADRITIKNTEDPGPAKKGKLRELGNKDNATIVFQPAPIRALHQARGHPAVMGPSASASVTSTRRDLLPINVHPMQYLHAGDKARVIGPAENNGAAVIKVIRSPSGPVKEGGFEVLRDMSTAIFYIYRQKIVHNDIKPDNILYSPTRGAVLIDFGLSTEITGRSSGLYTAGFPCDIWSFAPISAEVLAFAVEGSEFVAKFGEERKISHLDPKNYQFWEHTTNLSQTQEQLDTPSAPNVIISSEKNSVLDNRFRDVFKVSEKVISYLQQIERSVFLSKPWVKFITDAL
ncbi:hypothetical protein PspLS_12109 [Pyricularia sp. CBS 133598]|nr:hypothetical protein PspLS_12109 [Pyricularia sp. CBS 133598]